MKFAKGLVYVGIALLVSCSTSEQASVEESASANAENQAADAKSQEPPESSVVSNLNVNSIALPKYDGAGGMIVSICADGGPTYQDVELYDGTLGPTKKFVADNEVNTLQLQWLSSAEIERSPGVIAGDVANQRWCTGALIENNLLLTAAHCVQPGTNDWRTPYRINPDTGQGELISASELTPMMKVNFGYQVDKTSGNIKAGNSYPIVQLVEYGFELPSHYDFALIEIGRNSEGKLPSENGELVKKVSGKQFSDGDEITIIQHPSGKPKKIESGTILTTWNGRLYYQDLDTESGSSGSSIVNSSGEIIGVHTNGGCAPGQSNQANAGYDINAIIKESSKL